MNSRHYTLDELTQLIQNRDNPKTMDYYLNKMLNIFEGNDDARVFSTHNGAFTANIRSNNPILEHAFVLLRRGANKNILFVMRMFEEKIFPKSKTFKIVSRTTCPVYIVNPLAGQVTETKYSSGYLHRHVEEPTKQHPKPLILYSKNNWDRKGMLTINSTKVDVE